MVLEGYLTVTGGSGGGIGCVKVMATCITCSSKAILSGFVSGKVGFLPLLPRLFLIVLLFPGVSDAGETIRRQDGLGGNGDQHVVRNGELGASSLLGGRLHHVDVDGNAIRLVEVLLHIGYDVYSINGMAASNAFAGMLHKFEGRHFGVKCLRVFQFPIPRLFDVGGEEARDDHFCHLVEVVVLFSG